MSSLLRTQLHIPPPREQAVARLRLYERLDRAQRAGGRLILVCAPAGFGKTTLLSQWLARRADAVRTAWLSLDEGEADPARFFAQLVAAVRTVEPEAGQATLALTGAAAGRTAGSWGREPMAALINELDELPAGLHIVLDDYQHVAGPAIHEAVQFLLDHMPPACRLTLLTREDPPLALARLRARGQVVELRADDLRFTAAEALSFLDETMGLALPPRAVDALAARTEGWVAGLQLAALSLQGLDDVTAAGFIADFSGSHRYVIDYLAEEVLARQPAFIRAFLQDTAALDRLCGPLCDAVTAPPAPGLQPPPAHPQRADQPRTEGDGQSEASSQAILEHLDRANLFLLPLDGERRWYRYHRLFADFLRAGLSRAAELEQHRRAAAWFAANGYDRDAAAHALAAEDWPAAARLIAAAAADLLRTGEVTTLADWLAALPDAILQAHEELIAHRALAALLTGRLAEAARWAAPLADAETDRPGAPRGGREWTIAAWLASVQGRPDLLRFAHQADALTSDGDPFYRTLALITLGMAQNVEGDVAGSDTSFRRAYELSAAAGQPFAALGALTNLCFNLLEEGRFREADALAQDALARYVDRRGRPLPVLGILYVPLAVLAYARDDLAQAENYAREGLALCRRLFSSAILGGDAEITLAQILFARGEREQAHAVVEEARRAAAAAGVAVVAERLALQDALLALRAGHAAPAEQFLAQRGAGALAANRSDRARLRLLEARLLLARGQPGAARAALADLGRAVAAIGHAARLVQIRVWEAGAADTAGERPAALAALREALRLAAPENYRRAFLDAGSGLAELLRSARDAAPEFVDDLLARLAAQAHDAAPATSPEPLRPEPARPEPAALVDPLSERELEILTLIAQGASNRQIADRLVVTVGTAKWHVHNILQKLDATNRSQAIARARELQLL